MKKPLIYHRFRAPSRRLLFVVVGAAALSFASSCQKATEPLALTADEEYLIDAYVNIRWAGSLYPNNPEVAESLFTDLGAQVDTSRVSQIVRTLNKTPRRWPVIFREIEDRIRELAKEKRLERTRRGS